MDVQEKKPKVSICVVTYNQMKYIGKCLQSIVDQIVDFNFEVIIGDDCSTDGTREILQKFADKYPKILKVIFHEKNIGAVQNYIVVHQKAIGEYVSHIDGDDWCEPNKIASQCLFLDVNLDCVAVVHKLAMRDSNGNDLFKTWPKRFAFKKYDLRKLVTTHPAFGNSSIMYRNGAISQLINSELKNFIDFQIYVHLALQGYIGAIDEKLGNYTCGVGVSSSQSLYNLAVQALIYAKTNGLEADIFQHSMARQYLNFAKKAIVEKDVDLFKHLICLSVMQKRIGVQQNVLYKLRNKQRALKLCLITYRAFKRYVSFK